MGMALDGRWEEYSLACLHGDRVHSFFVRELTNAFRNPNKLRPMHRERGPCHLYVRTY